MHLLVIHMHILPSVLCTYMMVRPKEDEQCTAVGGPQHCPCDTSASHQVIQFFIMLLRKMALFESTLVGVNFIWSQMQDALVQSGIDFLSVGCLESALKKEKKLKHLNKLSFCGATDSAACLCSRIMLSVM